MLENILIGFLKTSFHFSMTYLIKFVVTGLLDIAQMNTIFNRCQNPLSRNTRGGTRHTNSLIGTFSTIWSMLF